MEDSNVKNVTQKKRINSAADLGNRLYSKAFLMKEEKEKKIKETKKKNFNEEKKNKIECKMNDESFLINMRVNLQNLIFLIFLQIFNILE